MKIVQYTHIFVCLVAIFNSHINATETFDAVAFETSDNKTVLATGHPLLVNITTNTLNNSGLEHYTDDQGILHIMVFLPSPFLKQIFSIAPAIVPNIVAQTFINQAATDNKFTYTAIPTQLNYLFRALNRTEPIIPLADIPYVNDQIDLQHIAQVLTKQDWKPGFNQLMLRRSLIAPYLENIKKKYANDNNGYQLAMQPIKQALYNTIHYLTDLDTQTKESLELAKKIINSTELSNYFNLGGGSYIDYMLINLQLGNKENNQQFLNKLENHLQALLQTPAK